MVSTHAHMNGIFKYERVAFTGNAPVGSDLDFHSGRWGRYDKAKARFEEKIFFTMGQPMRLKRLRFDNLVITRRYEALKTCVRNWLAVVRFQRKPHL